MPAGKPLQTLQPLPPAQCRLRVSCLGPAQRKQAGAGRWLHVVLCSAELAAGRCGACLCCSTLHELGRARVGAGAHTGSTQMSAVAKVCMPVIVYILRRQWCQAKGQVSFAVCQNHFARMSSTLQARGHLAQGLPMPPQRAFPLLRCKQSPRLWPKQPMVSSRTFEFSYHVIHLCLSCIVCLQCCV